MNKLEKVLLDVGAKLGFEVAREVEASKSAWVDIVWFDKRVPFSMFDVRKPKMQLHPVIPMVGFEIERSTVLDVKYLKGTVANLQNLNAAVSVLVLGKAGPAILRKQSPKKYATYTEKALWQELRSKVMYWVYAEAKCNMRIVICTEPDIMKWARDVGVAIPD